MQLHKGNFTAGDRRKFTVDYDEWLPCGAGLSSISVVSDKVTAAVTDVTNAGRRLTFFLDGGVVGDTVTVTVSITDDTTQTKIDTLVFVVIAP